MNEDERIVRKGFWEKLKESVGKIPFSLDAVAMYYCAIDPKTPIKARITIFAALAYFISPVDVIPDLILAHGYTDDAAVITIALVTVNAHITEEHREKARTLLNGNNDDLSYC